MGTILNLGLQLSNVFSKNIGNEIFRQMQNSAQATEESLKNVAIMVAGDADTNAYREEYDIIQKIKEVKSALNDEEYQELVNNMKKVGQYQDQLDTIKQLNAAMRDDLFSKDFDNPLVKHLRDNQQTSEE
jgi:negative regulator of replication initiation